ncbi:thymidylate synthase [Bacillus phage Anath]|uniref:Thymidylate synthase n=1 Tax=Bacillus phage Anath TaxID=2108114 RepID=A0A2P1JUN2_9CAUD|nr:thymidylate synthase [Bacillus phage Anath]
MIVKLIAHTSLSENFINELVEAEKSALQMHATDGQMVALSAIRTCYSPNKPSEIVALEGEKYFKGKATDGGAGNDADRLIRHIVKSGHVSTLEHLTFTFSVEGVSRALLSQLTRHRVGLSFSVQSQRYVKQSSDSKHGGFDYVVPQKVIDKGFAHMFDGYMANIQAMYDQMIAWGVPQEDARAVLPQCATCNLVLTINLRALLDFYAKRMKGKGAQHEITQLAEKLKAGATEVEPWIESFFGGTK